MVYLKKGPVRISGLALATGLLLGAQTGLAEVPDDVFLKGDFIELGIHGAGDYGSSAPPDPALGFEDPWSSVEGGLGFVADFERNGWDTSSTGGFDPSGPQDMTNIPNYSGDYFLPGTPWEGFLVEFTHEGIDYTWRNYGVNGETDVTPVSLVNTSSGSTQSAAWVGLADENSSPRTGTPPPPQAALEVQQNTFFDVGDAQFFIEVTLTNTGSDTLQDVEYARHFDPDNEQNWTGDFATINYVTHPTGADNPDGFAEVVALGRVWAIPIALRIFHPNAVAHVNTGGLFIESPDDILDSPNQPDSSNPVDADVGIGVALRIEELAPGESETFVVAYVLNIEDIDDPTPPPPAPPPPVTPDPVEPLPVPVPLWAYVLMGLLMLPLAAHRLRARN